MTSSTARITSSGQLSLPAAIRRRWQAGSVIILDRGDHVVIRPLLDDPVAQLVGKYAGTGPTSEQTREQLRAEESAAEDRRASVRP